VTQAGGGLDRPLVRAWIVLLVGVVAVAALALIVPLGWRTPILGGGKEAQASSCGPAVIDLSRTGHHTTLLDQLQGIEANSTTALVGDAQAENNYYCGDRARGRVGLVLALAAASVALLIGVAWVAGLTRRRPAPPIPPERIP